MPFKLARELTTDDVLVMGKERRRFDVYSIEKTKAGNVKATGNFRDSVDVEDKQFSPSDTVQVMEKEDAG